MSGINLHTLLGNVGKIETRYSKDGKAIVNLSIATSEKWKDSTGQKQEKTDWTNVVVFGKPAEIISQYVNKGDKLFVQGKVVTRKYQDSTGQDRYATETVVDGFNGKFELLGSNNSQQSQQPTQQQQAPQQPPIDDFDQDIPF
jgi:single-strand DNA-binding protein